ncbi:hypothetical protein [Amaricoccus tamworthensis]|uniref:hypothetical protein n=1 Tax=Amaricoccus tamworthensis TaxID=57002 RepID=UPI003C7A1086
MQTETTIKSDRQLPSAGVICAVALLVIALAGAVTSLIVTGIRNNQVAQIETQRAVSEAHLSRARSCMDLAADNMGDPGLLERARLQINMSKGIVACLVRNRDNAVLDVAQAAECIRLLEVENQLQVESTGGGVSTVPPC